MDDMHRFNNGYAFDSGAFSEAYVSPVLQVHANYGAQPRQHHQVRTPNFVWSVSAAVSYSLDEDQRGETMTSPTSTSATADGPLAVAFAYEVKNNTTRRQS